MVGRGCCVETILCLTVASRFAVSVYEWGEYIHYEYGYEHCVATLALHMQVYGYRCYSNAIYNLAGV